MRTNLTNLKSRLALATWQPCIRMRSAAMFANCLSSFTTYAVGGGFNQKQGQTIESPGLSDRRRHQI